MNLRLRNYKGSVNWVLFFISFFFLFFLAYYLGKLLFFFQRLFIFLCILCFYFFVKSFYYFLCLPFFEEQIKNFFFKYSKINKICLFILKWTNLVYIYNDILIIIIKFMSFSRYYIMKLDNKKVIFYFWFIDLGIYCLFFIIIKNIINILVLKFKKSKKQLVESDFVYFFKKRLLIWVCITYLILYFAWNISIFYLILFYLLYIFILSLKRIRKDLKIFKISEKDRKDWLNFSNFIFLSIKYNQYYDKFMETIYIFKHCKIPVDLNLLTFNLLATSKLVDFENLVELKCYNENYYWYQYDLYFNEQNKNKLFFWIIDQMLYFIKLNILYIMRIDNELNYNKKITELEKNFLFVQKKKYENNLLILKKFFGCLEICNLNYVIILCDIELNARDSHDSIVKKIIELRFKCNNITAIEFLNFESFYNNYTIFILNLRELVSFDQNYNYSVTSQNILKFLYVEVWSIDSKLRWFAKLDDGLISEEKFNEKQNYYEKKNKYIYTFNYYLKDYLNIDRCSFYHNFISFEFLLQMEKKIFKEHKKFKYKLNFKKFLKNFFKWKKDKKK